MQSNKVHLLCYDVKMQLNVCRVQIRERSLVSRLQPDANSRRQHYMDFTRHHILIRMFAHHCMYVMKQSTDTHAPVAIRPLRRFTIKHVERVDVT